MAIHVYSLIAVLLERNELLIILFSHNFEIITFYSFSFIYYLSFYPIELYLKQLSIASEVLILHQSNNHIFVLNDLFDTLLVNLIQFFHRL